MNIQGYKFFETMLHPREHTEMSTIDFNEINVLYNLVSVKKICYVGIFFHVQIWRNLLR